MFGTVDHQMDNKQYKFLVKTSRDMLKRGASVDDVVVYLSDKGVCINWIIYIIEDAAKLSYKDAKETVTQHPKWRDVADASREVQGDIEATINNDIDALLRSDGTTVLQLDAE